MSETARGRGHKERQSGRRSGEVADTLNLG